MKRILTRRIVTTFILLTFVLCVGLQFAPAQDSNVDLDKKLDRLRDYVNSIMEDSKVPGLALGIVKDGEVVFAEGFGYRDKENGLPVTTQTLFAIGSSSKAFTTAALGILKDEDVIDWDEPVITYLPSFRLKDTYITAHMTVRDLVTHRSGLPRHDALWYGSPFSRKEIFDRLKYLDFSAGFRERWQYNNLMFMTAGYLAGQVSGGTWEQFVGSRIFEPLGMTSSNFSVTKSETTDDFAKPYKIDDDTVELIPFRNIDEIGPAGSINSTIDDMLKWIQFHLDKGKVGEEQIISASEMRNMHTPQMNMGTPMQSNEQSHASYGLAWMIKMYRGHKFVEHGGGIDGFTTTVGFMPFDSIGVFVVNNAASPISAMVSLYAFDLLLDLEPVDRYAKMKEAQEKAEEEEEEDTEEKPVPDTQPSHPLADYAGKFEHPGYGIVTIENNENGLSGKYNTFQFDLNHWHYDVFKTSEALAFGELKLAFHTNRKGDIDKVSIQLEPSVDDIVFERKAADELSEPEYLARFVGEYLLGAITVKVEVKGGVLYASPTGQPTLELVPYKKNEFDIKGLSGYSTKFTVENGVATEMIFHQPNGVFTAKRKN